MIYKTELNKENIVKVCKFIKTNAVVPSEKDGKPVFKLFVDNNVEETAHDICKEINEENNDFTIISEAYDFTWGDMDTSYWLLQPV